MQPFNLHRYFLLDVHEYFIYKSEKIDPARHLLQLPPEPTLVVENVPKRTAVSEIPPVEMELLDTFVKECIQAYTMPNSFIHNSSSGILLRNAPISSSRSFNCQKIKIS